MWWNWNGKFSTLISVFGSNPFSYPEKIFTMRIELIFLLPNKLICRLAITIQSIRSILVGWPIGAGCPANVDLAILKYIILLY